MAKFDRTYRQKIVDEYLNDTGRNAFVPKEFLEWLAERPDHRAYPLFFDKTEEEAAKEWRLGAVRSFVSGLRIRIGVSTVPSEGREISVAVDEDAATSVKVPAFYSPTSGRREGGGYYGTDVNDPAAMKELARQAAADLRRSFDRHGGVGVLLGVDLSPLPALAARFDALAAKAE